MASAALQRIKKEHNPHARWDIETKFKAVESWLLYGNLRLTAEVLGVGYSTLKQWKAEEWWRDVEREIQAGGRIRQTTSIGKIVDRGLEVIQDRLENGEVVLDQKSGELVRRPVALRDVGGVVSNLMQRQSILEKQSLDEITGESHKTIQEQLAFLALEFSKFNNRSKVAAETIEYREIDNADSREMGEDDTGTEITFSPENEILETEESGEMEPIPEEEISGFSRKIG